MASGSGPVYATASPPTSGSDRRGVVSTGAPPALRDPLPARVAREVERVADLYVTAQVPRLDFYDKLRRELLLGPDPLSVAQINLRRLVGLVRPGTGLPPGVPERRQP